MNTTKVHIKFNQLVLGGYLFEELLMGREASAEQIPFTVLYKTDKRQPHIVEVLNHSHLEEDSVAKSLFTFEVDGTITKESIDELNTIRTFIQNTLDSHSGNKKVVVEEIKLEIIKREMQTIQFA